MTRPSAVTVTREELIARRERLLKRSRLTWEEMQSRAENWQLVDDEQDLYDTIRGIDYLLGTK